MTLKELTDELTDATDSLSREGLGDANTNDLHWAKKLAELCQEFIETYETEFDCIDNVDDTEDVSDGDDE